MMEIKFKITGVDVVQSMIHPDVYKKAITRSINRAANKGFTVGSKKIREMYNFKASDIKKETKIFKASWSKQYAVIDVYSDSRTSLKRFNARQTKKGVSFKIRKNRGRSLIRGGFISDKLGDHVFKRTTKKRLPIKKMLADVSVAELFKSRFVFPVVKESVTDTLVLEFKSNWNYYASRARRKS